MSSGELVLDRRGLAEAPVYEAAKHEGIRKLDLSSNRLTTFESLERGWPNLTQLVADNNQIEVLADVFRLSRLSRLNNLSLIGNPVTRIEGYRHIVLALLPNLEALDRMPVTPEDKLESQKYCRRSFAFLPTVIQNLANITIFKRMNEHLLLNQEIASQSLSALRELEPLEYKTLFKQVSKDMREEIALTEYQWTVQILEDIKTLVDDLKQRQPDAEFVFDFAFMEMMQRQLAKTEDLRDSVQDQITLRNSTVASVHRGEVQYEDAHQQNKDRSPASRAFQLPIQSAIAQLGTASDREHNMFKWSDPRDNPHLSEGRIPSTYKRSVEFRGAEENIPGITYHQMPYGRENVQRSGSRGSMNENQRRVDDLTLACQTKDSEITSLMSRNMMKEDNLRKLESKLQSLFQRQDEVLRLEEVRGKLESEQDRLSKRVESLKDYQREVRTLESEIRELKEEVASTSKPDQSSS